MPHLSNFLASFGAAVLAILPIGNTALVLLLLVVADLAIALLTARVIARRRKKTDEAVVVLDGGIPMHLRRRTEPAMRARRPIGVVEMQVRWRQAAEAHRQGQKSA